MASPNALAAQNAEIQKQQAADVADVRERVAFTHQRLDTLADLLTEQNALLKQIAEKVGVQPKAADDAKPDGKTPAKK